MLMNRCNTRKQHGLLVIPIEGMGDKPHVLLSSLDETVIQHGAPFNLGLHQRLFQVYEQILIEFKITHFGFRLVRYGVVMRILVVKRTSTVSK